MHEDVFRGRRRVVLTSMVAAGAVIALAACSSSGGTSGGSGGAATGGASAGNLPASITVVSTNPTTGVVAFAGSAANKGYDLAVKEINAQKFLGNTTLTLSKVDTKSTPATAAQVTTTAIADKSVATIFGSVSSNEAVAQSPLVQKAGMPIIYTQAGSDGVVIGDYTYRATPLMREYYPIIKKFMTDKGYKSVGIVYTQATPTLQNIGSQTLPAIAKELGMTVTGSVGVVGTTQDFSAPISQILSGKPDVVSILLVGASNPTAMKQLRQAGYTGDVLGNSGASAGNLKPAGADGAGMVWPVDFNYQMAAPSSQKFAKAYAGRVRRAAAQLRRRGLRRGVVPRQVDQAGRQRRPGRDQGRHGRRGQGEVRRRPRHRSDVAGPRPAGPGRRGPLERHRRGPPLRGHRLLTPIAATARRGRPILWTAPTGYGHNPG